jgi:hypothetical protein
VPRAIILRVPPYCPVLVLLGEAAGEGAPADVEGAVVGLGAAAVVEGADDGGAAAVAVVVLGGGGAVVAVGEEQAGNSKAINMITMIPRNTQFFLTFFLLLLSDIRQNRQSK